MERVLDMGCGWGAMTVMTLSRFPSSQVTMADVNERALDFAITLWLENGAGQSVLSGGFANIEGEFDALSQPPIRAGKTVILSDVTGDAKRTSPTAAHSGAGYPQAAGRASAQIPQIVQQTETIGRDGGYWVIACRK